MLKKIWTLLALAYTTALTVLCLMTLKNIPNVGVSFADKIFHCLAYLVLTSLWTFALFYNFKLKKTRSIWMAFIVSVAFGIIIEVLQGTVTSSRSLDVYDMLANTFGALVATGVLSVIKFKHIK